MSEYYFVEGRDSICCAGAHINYWWVNSRNPLKNESAVLYLLDEIESYLGKWDWNDWALDTEMGIIEDLLQRAIAGRLRPIDEVKPLNRTGSRLFEIRAAVQATRLTYMMNKVVDRRVEDVHLRIYHAEERTMPNDALGLHWHQKMIDGDDSTITARQDQEINTALAALERGRADRWGI